MTERGYDTVSPRGRVRVGGNNSPLPALEPNGVFIIFFPTMRMRKGLPADRKSQRERVHVLEHEKSNWRKRDRN